MGFVNELRNAPEKKKEEMQKRKIEDKKEFEKILIDLIKKSCINIAEQNNNSFSAYIMVFCITILHYAELKNCPKQE